MIIIRKLNFSPITIITQTGSVRFIQTRAPILGNPMMPRPGPIPATELGNTKSSPPDITPIGKEALRRKWTPVNM